MMDLFAALVVMQTNLYFLLLGAPWGLGVSDHVPLIYDDRTNKAA